MKGMDSRRNISKGDEDSCLADSGTTNSILRNTKYFSTLKLCEANAITIAGSSNIIEGSGRATIILPRGTKIIIEDALYSTRSLKNLLSFKDIRLNGYHVETGSENDKEYLYITSSISCQKRVLERREA